MPHSEPIDSEPINADQRRCQRWSTGAGVLLLLLHAGLVMWLAWRMTPTQDEVAHLPAGLAIWEQGRTDVYAVNPPLVRAWSALPLLLAQHNQDWTPLADGRLGPRREWALGAAFVQANGRRTWWLMTLARWACLPFTLLGGWVLWRWGRELWGDRAALVPLALWCCSPNITSYAALITPDIPSVSMLLLAAWAYSHWLRHPSWSGSLTSGLTLGLAWLTKSQWIILLPLWVLLWLWHRWGAIEATRRPTATQFLLLVLLGWNVLCVGYAARGLGQPVGALTFYSQRLSGNADGPGNRFAGTLVGRIPNPVPRDFLTGIDLQMRDFEQGRPAYLLGRWRAQGVWWFYLLGLAVKVPVGTLLLAATGAFITPTIRDTARQGASLLPLVLPALAVFLVASWQTSLHVYVRYVFCLLPVLFLLAGRAWDTFLSRQGRGFTWVVPLLLIMAIGESLWHFPHTLSYFNLVSGGPAHGADLLQDANVDWGQDLRSVEEWLSDHPERRPVTLAWPGLYPTAWIGMPIPTTPFGTAPPGWHLISRTSLTARHAGYRSFHDLTPVGTIGGTILVYHVPSSGASTLPSPATHRE